MKLSRLLLLALLFLNNKALGVDYPGLSLEVINIFMASKEVLFEKQAEINSANGDKSSLFGQLFLHEIDLVYRKNHGQPLPKADHPIKALLYQSILSVMEDNRALIMDPDLVYKGLIPATFSFQLSQRFSNSGYPVKIKFVGLRNNLVNEANNPDVWEYEVLSKVAASASEDSGLVQQVTEEKGRSMVRTLKPIYFSLDCLSCHGTVSDNSVNEFISKEHWTLINKAGFKMPNYQLGDLAGGVSLKLDVLGIQEGGNLEFQ